jgi:hypothetical protein
VKPPDDSGVFPRCSPGEKNAGGGAGWDARGVLIWINGTFGVGKTQAAASLRRRLPGSVVVDPEEVGFGIHRMQPAALRGDFQDTPWWEPTVTGILLDVLARHPGDVIVPMTLVDVGRHERILGALRDAGHEVRHVTLLASDDVVVRRLRTRLEGPDGWAAAQLPRTAALRGLRFADHVDTDGLTHAQAVEAVALVAGVSIGPDRTGPLRRAVDRMRVRIAHAR